MKKKSRHKAGPKARSVDSGTGLKLVAAFEGAKGVLVLFAGCGLLLLVHRDLHQAASDVIRLFHLNPASRYPLIFLDVADRTSDARLWAMAGGAVAYSIVRFTEAAGLWLKRKWAEWFGFLSGSLYLPLEMYELTKGITWQRVAVFSVNSVIVVYLLYILLSSRSTGNHNS